MNTNIKLIVVIVVSSLITLSLLYGLSIGTYKSVMRCSKERAVAESSKSCKPCECPCGCDDIVKDHAFCLDILDRMTKAVESRVGRIGGQE